MIDVGIFVALGIGLTMMIIFFIGRDRNFFERTYTLIAPFEDISGLRMGAVVQLSGLNVGYVDGVRFPEEETKGGLEVILKINVHYQERIRKDSKATIETQGLLGDRYVSITTGSHELTQLEDGEKIMTEGIGGVPALTKTGREMMEDIRVTAKKVQEVLDKLPIEYEDRTLIRNILGNVDNISRDLSVVSSKIRKGEGSIGAFLSDPALYHDLRALMGRANRNKLLKNMIRATVAEQEKATTQPVEKN